MATTTDRKTGRVKGRPMHFVNGHNARVTGGPRYNGGRKMSSGYVKLSAPEHPDADSTGYVGEHNLLAERALGRRLPPSAEVHHVNSVRADNGRGNLVVCQDHAYHMLLHQRARALKACGHPDWLVCSLCKRYDDPTLLYHRPPRGARHPACHAQSELARYHRGGQPCAS